ncbi:uncharacterized protein [Symphalangus syndactylus]|uniref:uncharacterized protein isoform X2 n=1 Tax=Symphalangus syndactylus TaxID=9590 RepID=UPI003006CCB5
MAALPRRGSSSSPPSSSRLRPPAPSASRGLVNPREATRCHITPGRKQAALEALSPSFLPYWFHGQLQPPLSLASVQWHPEGPVVHRPRPLSRGRCCVSSCFLHPSHHPCAHPSGDGSETSPASSPSSSWTWGTFLPASNKGGQAPASLRCLRLPGRGLWKALQLSADLWALLLLLSGPRPLSQGQSSPGNKETLRKSRPLHSHVCPIPLCCIPS